MPDGPRKASLRAPTTMERIKSGLQDVLGIPEATWGMPLPDQAIEARRELDDARAAKGPVMRAPTVMERIQETLRPVTNVVEAIGNPLENAEMGPAKAITLVTKRPMLDLLKKLHPRNAAGMLVDPQEFPNITDAVSETVTRYPRVASHLNSIDMTATGSDLGRFVSPNQYTKQIQSMGADAYRRNWDAPIGKIELNPSIETMTGRGAPIDTLTHEFGHAAQYIADPRRFQATYDVARNSLNHGAGGAARFILGDIGYKYNPAEIAARAIGARGMERYAGKRPTSYADALMAESADYLRPDKARTGWQESREVFEKWARDRGVPIKPRF
jgi:hypothetical protein